MEKNKKIEIYKNLILDVPGVKSAQFDKSIESSVTTSWGVNWDADFIARDILQNFRDSNLSEIEKVVVNTKNDKILVEGNNCFDLRKLFFVGSNKAGDDTTVGEYGEGFKAAVVSMLKRGIQAPVSVSGAGSAGLHRHYAGCPECVWICLRRLHRRSQCHHAAGDGVSLCAGGAL